VTKERPTTGAPGIAEPALPSPRACRLAVADGGFAFVGGDAMGPMLERHGALSDWTAFAASWDALELDGYMADGGRYRRRRHAVYAVAKGGAIARAPHQAHYQDRAYNALNGGVARWFAPITEEIGAGPTLGAVLAFCAALFGELSPETRAWRVEVHQLRIEARPGVAGLPTPEGVHRDGVDYVLVLLVARRNIVSGTTTIHAPDGRLLGAFTLTRPLDAALVHDARVHHGVTAVEPLDPDVVAHRDVLVVTFRGEPPPG
jgi:hypothetical protein